MAETVMGTRKRRTRKSPVQALLLGAHSGSYESQDWEQTGAYAENSDQGIRSLVLVEWLEVPERSLGQGKKSLLTTEI